jgi:hypothetical protein
MAVVDTLEAWLTKRPPPAPRRSLFSVPGEKVVSQEKKQKHQEARHAMNKKRDQLIDRWYHLQGKIFGKALPDRMLFQILSWTNRYNDNLRISISWRRLAQLEEFIHLLTTASKKTTKEWAALPLTQLLETLQQYYHEHSTLFSMMGRRRIPLSKA